MIKCHHCNKETPKLVYCVHCKGRIEGILQHSGNHDEEEIKKQKELEQAEKIEEDHAIIKAIFAFVGTGLVGLTVFFGVLFLIDSNVENTYRGSRQEKKDFIEWNFERSREKEQERIEEELYDGWNLRR